MPEKCVKCGQKPSENKKGYLCPVCGDYFCYNCSQKMNNLKEKKNENSPKCPSCNVFLFNSWPL